MAKLIIGNSTVTPVKVVEKIIEVPVVPPHCVEYTVNEDGQLQDYTLLGATWPSMDMTGITDLGANVFREQTSGRDGSVYSVVKTVDLSTLNRITGDHALYDAFYNVDGSNIQLIDLSNVEYISSSSYTCGYAFYNMRPNSTGNELVIDLSSLQTINGSYACAYMFQGVRDIYTVSMPFLTSINGSNAARNMFAGCGDITSISLGDLQQIGPNANTAYNMFGGATNPASANPEINSSLGSIYLPSLINITNNSYLFSYNPYLTSVVLGTSNLTLSATNDMFHGCSGLSSIDFMDSVSTVEDSGMSYMFYDCVGLYGDIHLRNVTYLGSNACNHMFTGCTGITTITFDSIAKITNNSVFRNICDTPNNVLTDIYFPSLGLINSYEAFSTMLTNNNNQVTLHFSSSVADNEMFQNIINVVGGNETSVLFDQPALPQIEITIPVEYTEASVDYENITIYMDENRKINIPFTGSDIALYVKLHDNNDQIYMYQFDYIYSVYGLSFTLPEKPNNLRRIVLNSSDNVEFYTYLVNVTTPDGLHDYSFSADYDPAVTSCETYIHVQSEMGYYAEIYLSSNDPNHMRPAYLDSVIDDENYGEFWLTFDTTQTLFTINGTNFLDYFTLEADDKWSIEEIPAESGEYVLRIHQDEETKTWATKKSVPINLPEGMSNLWIKVEANADSENNYDFGYMSVDNGATVWNASQVKNWNHSGILVFKDCGDHGGYNPNYFETECHVNLEDPDYNPLMLTVGFAQDSSTTKFTNSFYIKSITVIGF